MGNPQGSLDEMQKAIRLDPNRSSFYMNLAMLQVNAKQTSAAEESYNEAISQDPKSPTALSERGPTRLMVAGPNSHTEILAVGASNTVGPGEITILGLSKSWPRLPWHSLPPGNLDRPVVPSVETARPSRNDERPYRPYPSDTGTGDYSDLLERIPVVER